ncbi:MAG: hypothetical protein QOD03_1260 [Verrucomicrobiota bacterium]|jgi:FMN phosphatase YigB (HAD superfamily)
MIRPLVVVFDLGKVLLDFDYSIASQRISSRCQSVFDPPHFFREHAALLVDYETGRLTTENFFGQLCAFSGFSGTADEFGTFFAEIFTPIQPMIELHAQLQQKGWPTFIFSNTNEFQIAHIRQRYPFFANFDGYILSFEHGSMKPDAKLYEVVERETKRSGSEILYIDDRPENIEAGAARGWQAVLHESPEQTISILKKLGML